MNLEDRIDRMGQRLYELFVLKEPWRMRNPPNVEDDDRVFGSLLNDVVAELRAREKRIADLEFMIKVLRAKPKGERRP